jgi:peptidoglycan hydrolase-like protein with peptidoglycan-binding domain
MKFSISQAKCFTTGLVLMTSLSFLLGVFGVAKSEAQTVHAKSKLTDKISDLLLEIQTLQKQLAEIPSPDLINADNCAFIKDLHFGSSGDDVKCLQSYLLKTGYIKTDKNLTGYFGPITEAAVSVWQTDNNVTPALGYFGPVSRLAYENVPSSPVSKGELSEAKAVYLGSELAVINGGQESGVIAPIGAARIPLLKFILGANSDGNILVKSLKLKAETLSTQSSLESIFIADSEGEVIGSAKRFGGNLTAVFDEPFVVRAGTIEVVTVFGNRAFHATGAGEIIEISLIDVNAGTAKVNGSLPVTGPEIVINTFLSLGEVLFTGTDLASSNSLQTPGKERMLLSFRLQNNDREKINLKEIRLYQSGSVNPEDLKNINLKIGDKSFPVSRISQTNYYIADINLVLNEKDSLTINLIADIVGGSEKTVAFNIKDGSDVWLQGINSGYSILPHQRGVGLEESWYQPKAFKIDKGIIKITATEEKNKNIAINVANQILGSFLVEAYGEPVLIEEMVFRIEPGLGEGILVSQPITNVILEGPGGVLAGPVDQVESRILFKSPVTFPIGPGEYILKGAVAPSFGSNRLLRITARPGSEWRGGIGSATNKPIVLESKEVVTGGEVTVRSATLSISVAKEIPSPTIKQGTKNSIVARYQFDASESGEDIRVKSFITQLSAVADNSQELLRNCRLFEGENILNTGSSIIYPKNSADDVSFYTFALDTNLIVPKSKKVFIDLICDITSDKNKETTFSWGLPTNTDILANIFSVTSGEKIVPKTESTIGPAFTVTSF